MLGKNHLTFYKLYGYGKNVYPSQVFDLRFQVDQISPNKVQSFVVCRGATTNARLFMILFRHKEVKNSSDGNEKTEVINI